MTKKIQYSIILLLVTTMMLINIDQFFAYGDVGNAFSGSVSSSSSSADGGGLLYLIFFIPFPWNFLVIGLIAYLGTMGVDKSKTSRVVKYETNLVTNEELIVNNIRRVDPNFSKYAFLTYAKECLITIQESIEQRDLTQLTPFVDKKYYEMLALSLNSEYDFYYEGQEILNATIKDAYENGDQYIVVELFVSEYFFSVTSGEQVSDNNYGVRTNNVYELKFRRSSGVITKDIELKVTSCPNCGAPNAFDNYGICEYCDSEISTGDYSFVLYEMNNIAEKSSIYYRLYHSNKLGALNNELQVVEQIKRTDPSFDLDSFEKFVENSFVSVQEAWESRDLEAIRIYESTDLNDIHASQIKEYIKKQQYPHIDDQIIKDINVNRFEIDGNYEYLTVVVAATLKVFVTDESGTVISGNSKLDNKRGYLLRYKRGKGVKSNNTMDSKNCPNCGSEIKLGDFGSCDYCGSSIINGEHGWIMDSYEAINRV